MSHHQGSGQGPRHIENHVLQQDLRSDTTLHVIGVISNPVRYQSRYRIARQWIKQMARTPNVQLHIVETAYGDRHHEIRDLCEELGVNFLALRTRSEIWIKENMINLGVRYLFPYDWQYMAWVDADVFFTDDGWALETLQQLQHFEIVQPWSDCIDLGFKGNVLEHHKSFGYLNSHDIRRQRKPGEPYKFGHPGFAWACTRKFWEACRGLIDFAILGSADHHMACAMVGEVDTSMHHQMHASFKKACTDWQKRAHDACGGFIGYVPGRVEHHFHGPKKRRYYRERWQILVDHGFDPGADLHYDAQGVPYLHGKPKLERAIRQYNRSRLEDSIEDT